MARHKKPTSFDDLAEWLSEIHDRLHTLEHTCELIRKHSQNLNRRLLKFLDETPKKKKDDEYLRPKDVSILLAISESGVHKLIQSGSIQSIEIPGTGTRSRTTRRIPRSEVDRILKKTGKAKP